jgi:hypothetical protein
MRLAQDGHRGDLVPEDDHLHVYHHPFLLAILMEKSGVHGVENGGSVVAPLGSRLTCYIGREHPRRGLQARWNNLAAIC